MRRLVALDLPAGQPFIDATLRCHAAGDAVLPVDQRLPKPAIAALFNELRPSVVIGKDGEAVNLDNGLSIEDGDAFVVATSGTTGKPRGVVLTHESVHASSVATSVALGTTSGDHWLCCLPVSHVGGLSIISRALATDTKLTMLEQFDADAVLNAARHGGATLTSLVPTALFRIGNTGASLFRTILLGGSQIPAERPENTIATYGMTETGSGCVYEGQPLNGVEISIATSGEISLRAPMLFRCYRDGTNPKDKDGWFATGDAGAWGDDGRLVVHGRIGEVIVSGGEKIWPVAVEAVLRELPAVADVAIGGMKDAEWGERVVAYVVSTDETSPPSLELLRDRVRMTLGSVAAPREMVVVDALPRTAIGKIRRGELQKLHPVNTK